MIKERRILLRYLTQVAQGKPFGYAEAYLDAGRVEGEFLIIPEASRARLRRCYRGWGDRLHDMLKPFVRGTRWASCCGCRRRQGKLNRVGEAFWRIVNRWLS